MDTNCGSRGTEIVNSKVLASTLHAEPAEETIGHTPIRCNLLPQRIDVRELAFIPDALHESEPHRTTVQIGRVVEEMGFDRQLLLAKRRTHADVCDACVHDTIAVSYTHLRAHETPEHLVCRLLLEKKKK